MTDVNHQHAILEYTTRLGDDSVVLGHRLAEWCRNGPFLEEDLALANVALDYIGRARMFYGYAAELAADGRTEDHFAYMRNEREFRNLLIHELPRGDFAYTMVRQLFIDFYNLGFLDELTRSSDGTLAGLPPRRLKKHATIAAAAKTGF